MADAHGTALHVVHALPENEFRDLERTSFETRDTSVDMEEIENLAREIAEEAVAEADVDADEVVGLVGKPSQRSSTPRTWTRRISSAAAGNAPRSGRSFGSVTQSILLNADRPVSTVMEA